MIEIENLNFNYKSQKKSKTINNLSFKVDDGQIACLLGPSGCGKTSTLRLIAGLETPSSGSIVINGQCVASTSVFVPPDKRDIGFVFQDFALFPHLTVQQNIGWGLTQLDQNEKTFRIEELLKQTSMLRHKDKYPHELSGGEQQRVSLARALAPRPRLLLLDEPFSSLDANLRNEIRKETSEILKISNSTAIVVTHDAEEAMLIADQIILMSDGEITQDGTSKELFNYPKNDFVASFFGYINRLDGIVENGVIQTVLGEIPNKGFQKGERIDIFIRPHDFRLTKEEDGTRNIFTIEDIKFLGPNTHIWFNSNNDTNRKNQILAIQVKNKKLNKGDSVTVTLDTPNLIMFKQSN